MQRSTLPATEIAEDSRQRTKNILALVFIALAVWFAYFNTLHNDFVHDDRIEILQNTFIHDFSHLSKILTSPAWAFRLENPQGGSNYYRPLQYLTYAVLYHFLGPSPWGYHLFKLLLHLAVCLVFFWIICHYLKNWALALLSALMFAVHPANTEAVAWISGITDVACAVFFLLCLLFYLRSQATPSFTILLAFYAMFLFGLFAKETMVTLMPILFLYEWIHFRKAPTRKHWLRVYVPLLVGFVIYLSMRIYAIGSFTSASQLRYSFLSGFQSFLNQVVLLSEYFTAFFFPLSLNAYHLFDPVLSLTDYRVAKALTALAIVLVVCWLSSNRMQSQQRNLMLWGLLWFVMALSPVLIFLKRIGENVLAERYLYLPSLGLSLSLSIPLLRLREKMPRLMTPVLLVLLGLLTWKVIDRNNIWHDELSFYETTARASPRAGIILNNLGTAYARNGRQGDAVKALETSVSVQPNSAAYKNLARIYAAMGRHAQSETAYRQAAALNPGDADIFSGLGDLYFALQRYPESIDAYTNSISLNPRVPRVCFNLADACLIIKRYDKALAAYQKALSLSAREAGRAYRGMAAVYAAQNLADKAAEANRNAFELQP